MTAKPLAWGLLTRHTGKLDSRLFQRQESAEAAARRLTTRWRTVTAVPLVVLEEEPRC